MTKPQSIIYISMAAVAVLEEHRAGPFSNASKPVEIKPGIFAIYVDDEVLARLEERQKAMRGASVSEVILALHREGGTALGG